MPEKFDRCVKSGGRVRTKHVGKGKCVKICFQGGKSYAGHSFSCKPGKKRARGG